MTALRKPAVAGSFYPADPGVLLRNIQSYTQPEAAKTTCLACIVPHAGYMYSGHVAGAVYSRIQLPNRLLLLGPNHTGLGRPLAIFSTGAWLTPLGEAHIDERLARELMLRFPLLQEDTDAHRKEHCLEVQIPFLQALLPELSFVPIVIGTGRVDILMRLGESLAEVLQGENAGVLILTSSDMNHYEPDSITRVKDAKAIEKILALDAHGLHEVVERENISMCGFAPTVVMIAAARRQGATRAELLKYATSADVSGDREYCVGYAGIMVTRP
ncbi:MAG: AmmeMemoRadiSam system protein B [Acidobacteriales bacterium]|nr:AmmeMemoRadiSam system protein B [Terriglobales bacterium]